MPSPCSLRFKSWFHLFFKNYAKSKYTHRFSPIKGLRCGEKDCAFLYTSPKICSLVSIEYENIIDLLKYEYQSAKGLKFYFEFLARSIATFQFSLLAWHSSAKPPLISSTFSGGGEGGGGWKRSAGGLVGWGAVEVFPTQQRGNAETEEEEISPGPLRPSNRGGGGNCVKVDVGYTRAAPSPPWNNKFSTARPVTKVRGPPLFLGPLTARHTRKTHPFPSPLPFLFITGQMYGRGYKFPNNSNIVCRRDTPSPHFRPAFLFFLSWK